MKEEKDYELTKDLLDEMRDIEGFPLGEDKDIIALSDPPYYTACPNPWIEDFIKEYGKPYDEENDDYHREPFAFDVSEGKGDPIYNAHPYHTKVPYKAIMRYILHYTNPGDIVFDGFCGTGMTGVAAQMCGNPDLEFKREIEEEMPYVKWGTRKAILNDLCPSATFIAYNYNSTVDAKEFLREAKRVLSDVEKECGWMYKTTHAINGVSQHEKDLRGEKKPVEGKIDYTVWSDVFICPSCSEEIVFYEHGFDKRTKRVKSEFNCPHCDKKVRKNASKKSDALKLDRAWETVHDSLLNKTVKCAKQVPVLIEYTIREGIGLGKSRKRLFKTLDKNDLALLEEIGRIEIPYWFPSNRMPNGEESRRNDILGIANVHHFYTKRALVTLSSALEKVALSDDKIRPYLLFTFEQAVLGMAKIARYVPTHYSQANQYLSGTFYIGSLVVDVSLDYILKTKISRLSTVLRSLERFSKRNALITTQSSSELNYIPSNSIDYVFTDPPFGGNLMYSELNFLWEAWLKVFTNNKKEAVINNTQKKGLAEYKYIIEECFKEFFRILKPGRWLTVEFHNSKNSVWVAIQEALQRVGFVVADVRTLDKQQGTFKQITSTAAVKQDLIITAYKPNGGLEKRFGLVAGTEAGVWEFIGQHLEHIPVTVEKDGNLEIITERQNFLLFDRMVAFHVQRGVTVPISASDFYLGLRQRFPERDDMYFLPEQVVEYDRKRLTAKKVEQLSLSVHDEKSAVQWLRRELNENPQTFQEIQPKFLQILHKDKYERLPELMEVLEESFLEDEKGRWYIPNSSKQSDLERLREKTLLREFEKYKGGKGRLIEFRAEAVRAGFKKCWSDRDYKTIIGIGKRLPPAILQEDSTLLMFYDNAETREGDA